jgi:hypothetical protein
MIKLIIFIVIIFLLNNVLSLQDGNYVLNIFSFTIVPENSSLSKDKSYDKFIVVFDDNALTIKFIVNDKYSELIDYFNKCVRFNCTYQITTEKNCKDSESSLLFSFVGTPENSI